MEFSPDELKRYGRQLQLPEVGLEGQARLKAASVLVVGAGGLGSPLAYYLAAAGIGRLGIVDGDAVEASNLQRQILYAHADIGRPKASAAAARLRALNPFIEVVAHPGRLTEANVIELVGAYDIVADGSDNFATRYAVSDACALLGKPEVYGAVSRFTGEVSLFDIKGGAPCYRCLHPQPPAPGVMPTCNESGVLGVLPGIVGSLMAAEVLKRVLGLGETLAGTLLVVDALTLEFRRLELRKDPDCALTAGAVAPRI